MVRRVSNAIAVETPESREIACMNECSCGLIDRSWNMAGLRAEEGSQKYNASDILSATIAATVDGHYPREVAIEH